MKNRFKFKVWDKLLSKWISPLSLRLKEDGTFFDVWGAYIIQEWTGLTDKNGKEIYEGDIIIFMGRWDEKGNVLKPDYKPYEVAWSMGGLRAHTMEISCRSYHLHNEVVGVGHTDSKIVGNIFENPELCLKS